MYFCGFPKYTKWSILRLPYDLGKVKGFQLHPPTRGSAPGPRWGLRPQTPVLGSRSALAMGSSPPNLNSWLRPWNAVFAVVRCTSVRPSVTLVHCIHTAKNIVKLLVRPGSPIILVFWLPEPMPDTQFQGEPLQRGREKYMEVGKIGVFRLKSPFFSETYEIGP